MRHEYIVQVDDTDRSYDFAFVGQIRRTSKQLVRCKDCKYQYTDGDNVVANYCLLAHNRVQPDEWFCADGELREEE